jgi:hypothetical protein
MTTKALADQIVELARSGKIPKPFRVQDFRGYFPGFSEFHLRTVLANYAENGDMVIRAKQPARFKRVSKGLYRLV